jgi:hypothetical protein
MSIRRKRHTGWKIFLCIVAVCLIGAVIFWPQIKKTTTKKAAEVVVEKMLDNKISSDKADYGKMTAKDIYNSMDTEDKQKVTDIITNHMIHKM